MYGEPRRFIEPSLFQFVLFEAIQNSDKVPYETAQRAKPRSAVDTFSFAQRVVKGVCKDS